MTDKTRENGCGLILSEDVKVFVNVVIFNRYIVLVLHLYSCVTVMSIHVMALKRATGIKSDLKHFVVPAAHLKNFNQKPFAFNCALRYKKTCLDIDRRKCYPYSEHEVFVLSNSTTL